VISDNMAGAMMKQGKMQPRRSADRIAPRRRRQQNRTYTVAVLAKENGIPFFVAASDFNRRPRVP